MPLDQNKINKQLAEEIQSPLLLQLLKDSRALVDMSRRKMGTFYDQWDCAMRTFENVMSEDKDDKEAKERKEPKKMVVPIAYSQIMTFVAFCYALFTQRERMFELLGMSAEDHRAAKIGEAFIARDLTKNCFDEKLSQFLLDVGRFGLGVFKTYWVKETQRIKKTVTKPMVSIFGMNIGSTTQEVEEEAVKFLGNRILNVSPYRFFPDTRLPLSRFQEGEFCASEDQYTITKLQQMEHEGLVFGIEHIRPMSPDQLRERGPTRAVEDPVPMGRHTTEGYGGQSKGVTIVTEIQRVIVPSQYMVEGKPLGPEKYPVKYLLWYANDDRVIRFEPLNYCHDEFTYSLGQYTPDQHKLVGMSLADSIDMLQSVISWLINSHIASVRKVIGDRMVVDQNAFEMSDLKERRPVIRAKISLAGGIDKYLKQLDVQDVTQNHMADQEILHRIVQIVTGISDAMLGQMHTGRRSATEAKNSFSGAANRLKMIALLLFRTALEPLARQMLSNLRSGLDLETMVRVVGLLDTVESGPHFLKASKEDLVGEYDFEVFDGTLPSEKGFTAEAIGEVLMALIPNPAAAVALQMDPKALLREWLELRGVRNPERFALLPPPAQPNNVTQMPNADPNAAPTGNPGPGGAAEGVPPTEGESILSLVGGGGGEGGEAGGY